MADASLLGKFVWCELVTSDMKAAEAFYTKVIGWTVTPFEGGNHAYDVLNRPGGGGVGGVMKIPDGMNWPSHWLMYIGTPKLDETVAHAERLGGKAVSEVIDVPKVGRLRVMSDPQAGMFALMEPLPEGTTSDTPPQVGDVAWRELYTSDAPAAMQFYTELLGWQPIDPFDMGPMGKYYMFRRQFPMGGMMTKPPAMAQMPTSWDLYFRVPGVEAAAEIVKTQGGTILNGPMDVPTGERIVQCRDPLGAAFSLHQLKP